MTKHRTQEDLMARVRTSVDRIRAQYLKADEAGDEAKAQALAARYEKATKTLGYDPYL